MPLAQRLGALAVRFCALLDSLSPAPLLCRLSQHPLHWRQVNAVVSHHPLDTQRGAMDVHSGERLRVV